MADIAHKILEYLQRNHFTNAEAALRSELLDQKSSNGGSSLNNLTSLSRRENGGGHNANYSTKQKIESRDAEYIHTKSYRSNSSTAVMGFEKGMVGILKDVSDSEDEKLRSPPLYSKALSNKQTVSIHHVKDLECYSSTHEPCGEHRDANSEWTLYGNKQLAALANSYENGTLAQHKISFEQRKLQDFPGASEEIFVFEKDHMQFGNLIDNSHSGDPKLGLSGISNVTTGTVERLTNIMIDAKGNLTQDGEILQQDLSEVQYSLRKTYSTEDLSDQIEAISQVDGDKCNHALKEGNQNLRLHEKQNIVSRHDKKTSGSQIASAMLDVEPNIKSQDTFYKISEDCSRNIVSAHESGKNIAKLQDQFEEKRGYRSGEHSQSHFGPWKGGYQKTAFPFFLDDIFIKNEQQSHTQILCKTVNAGNEGIGQEESGGLMNTNKELVREGTPIWMLNYQGSTQKEVESPEQVLSTGSCNELYPRVSSKTLQVADNIFNVSKEKFDGGSRMDTVGPQSKSADTETLGPSFHVPVEQEIRTSGKKLTMGSRQMSESQTVVESFERFINYPTAQWNSGKYGDENDLGYIRQPVEDGAWHFTPEMYFPTDNEQWKMRHEKNPYEQESNNRKNEHDNQTFAENLHHLRNQNCQSNNNHDCKLSGIEETNSVQIGPEWQGFAQQRNEVEILRDEGNNQRYRANNCFFDDHDELVRSIGVGSCCEEDTGTNVRRKCIAGSGGLGFYECKPVKYDRSGSSNNSLERIQEVNKKQQVEDHHSVRYESDSWRDHKAVRDSQSGESDPEQCFIKDALKEGLNGLESQNACNHSLDFRGFSLASSSAMGDVTKFKVEPEKSVLSTNSNLSILVGKNYAGHNAIGPDDTFLALGRKSNESFPIWSEKDENLVNDLHTMHSIMSRHDSYGHVEKMGTKGKGEDLDDLMEDGEVERVEDEEVACLGQLIQQAKAQEDQFETFDLQIVHRRNRTGYEEVKDYHAVLNTVIAGRYRVVQNLGSAVFSNVVQAHDLCTGLDVCLKIIRNNKEFFDQSLDEIKLLKFVNKHDPADKYHLLRVYNYFYHREHLFIVCELLKANLYEFYKFNRESGGEAYFTMPRLQSIAIQCLEALEFLHNLGLIHCDLKPENILMKSYSRCEVKVIDLGSSCFDTDHLCSNVQSRSYRAPEVILGLPYDKRIDIWSLGCILAELCLGNVLFQSDSSATLLASIIAIIGPIDEEILLMGCETHKYFTKSYVLYERNQDTNRIEFLTPKRTSLKNKFSFRDQGFIDFVSYLLEINPNKRPTASAALQHPWLSYSYESISD